MAKSLEFPKGIGETMWHTVIKLLEEQEEVEIKYELISMEEQETVKECKDV